MLGSFSKAEKFMNDNCNSFEMFEEVVHDFGKSDDDMI